MNSLLHNGGMLNPTFRIPDPVAIPALCDELTLLASADRESRPVGKRCLRGSGASGGLAGFIPTDCGGTESGERALLEMLAAIASRCLTTTRSSSPSGPVAAGSLPVANRHCGRPGCPLWHAVKYRPRSASRSFLPAVATSAYRHWLQHAATTHGGSPASVPGSPPTRATQSSLVP